MIVKCSLFFYCFTRLLILISFLTFLVFYLVKYFLAVLIFVEIKKNLSSVLNRDSFLTLRQSMIDMVLATELTKHFEHVNKFISIVTKSNSAVLDQVSYIGFDLVI